MNKNNNSAEAAKMASPASIRVFECWVRVSYAPYPPLESAYCGLPLDMNDDRLLDTQRFDRLSCYGCTVETSPYIDELAANSTLFECAVAPPHANIRLLLFDDG